MGKEKKKKVTGTGVNEEVFEAILSLIEQGTTLTEACKKLNTCRGTFYNYMELRLEYKERDVTGETEAEREESREILKKERNNAYARAKVRQAEWLFDEMTRVAYDDTNDGEKGNKGLNSVKRAQLKIDSLKWAMGRLNPQKYAERLALTGGVDNDGSDKAIMLELTVNKPNQSNEG